MKYKIKLCFTGEVDANSEDKAVDKVYMELQEEFSYPYQDVWNLLKVENIEKEEK